MTDKFREEYDRSASKRFLDNLHDNRDAVKIAIHEIYSIIKVLEQVDMTRIANRLYDVAERLEMGEANMTNSFRDRQNEELQHSREGMANILTALVKGVEIGEAKRSATATSGCST